MTKATVSALRADQITNSHSLGAGEKEDLNDGAYWRRHIAGIEIELEEKAGKGSTPPSEPAQ